MKGEQSLMEVKRELIHLITNSYALPCIENIESITTGNTSNTYILKSSKSNWVLRRLQNESQAIIEYQILRYLVEKKVDCIVPFLTTTTGKGYEEIADEFWNLQPYIPGDMPIVNNRQSLIKTSSSLAYIQNALLDYTPTIEMPDRFSILALWNSFMQLINETSAYKSSDAFMKIKELLPDMMKLEKQGNQLIHGDFGIWNLIETKSNIFVIDFGEARKGDYYFDIAAAMTSSLSPLKLVSESYLMGLVEVFIKTYEKNGRRIDTNKLYKYIVLWKIRGILAVLPKYISDTNKSIRIAEKVFDELIMYENCLTK